MRDTLFSTALEVTAGTYKIDIADGASITLEATGLTGSETVDIRIPNASGYEADYVEGVQVQMTATNKSVRIAAGTCSGHHPHHGSQNFRVRLWRIVKNFAKKRSFGSANRYQACYWMRTATRSIPL